MPVVRETWLVVRSARQLKRSVLIPVAGIRRSFVSQDLSLLRTDDSSKLD